MSEENKTPASVVKSLIVYFIWGVLAVRFISSFTLPDYNGLVLSEWLSVSTWIMPVLFSGAMVLIRWRYYKKGQWPFD